MHRVHHHPRFWFGATLVAGGALLLLVIAAAPPTKALAPLLCLSGLTLIAGSSLRLAARGAKLTEAGGFAALSRADQIDTCGMVLLHCAAAATLLLSLAG